MSHRYYRNHEGYPDPTAGEAIANVMREQKKQLAVKNRNLHGKERRRANRRMKHQRSAEFRQRTEASATNQNNCKAKEV